MTKTKIHFVCMGNIFRSRIAEAYAKSLNCENIEFSSSGLHADRYPVFAKAPITVGITSTHRIDKFLSNEAIQTTNNILRDKDLIIFMHKNVANTAMANHSFNYNSSIHWNVKDIQDWRSKVSLKDKKRVTYDAIKRNVDQLIKQIDRGGWVDIVSEDNEYLGYKLPIYYANKKNLWHRGSHVIITTPNNKFIIEKRSPNIIFAPNYLDISLGGHVDAGEIPLKTAFRETLEELGIELSEKKFRLLNIVKLSRYHPRYKTHTRQHTYVFSVRLDSDKPTFNIQNSEVSEVFILSQKQVYKLINRHSIKHLGRLNSTYKFYETLIDELAVVV